MPKELNPLKAAALGSLVDFRDRVEVLRGIGAGLRGGGCGGTDEEMPADAIGLGSRVDPGVLRSDCTLLYGQGGASVLWSCGVVHVLCRGRV